ncbi:MAG TPA: hypothetical protein VIZ43_28975 [Trebonia sp.]
MNNISYLIYQAERPRSAAEQREADVRAGELAAAVARLGRSRRHSARGKQDARRDGERPATATVSCAIPRPR